LFSHNMIQHLASDICGVLPFLLLAIPPIQHSVSSVLLF
jgi:hypothetical protein